MIRRLLLGAVLLQMPVLADVPEPTRAASADLDGDGKPESITLDVKDSAKGSAAVANVRVGSTVTLLARAEVGATEKKPHRVSGSKAAPRGGEIWLLFKSETGLMGWVLDRGLGLEPSL
ncbi:hypothetical protein [Hyalangium versicolor]|uniref:hypothetical protein n=1 Tax=Hyalangium versicolor TaxID=2861190 RepID=UPI001CCEDD5D|nr:hypothetical protein [Hyalangium versicolor]